MEVQVIEKIQGRIDLDTRTIYTIEGNSGDSCREKTYSFDDTEVLGFGSPKYK